MPTDGILQRRVLVELRKTAKRASLDYTVLFSRDGIPETNILDQRRDY